MRHLMGNGLSKRRSRATSSTPDRNASLKAKIITLVQRQRHRRYSASMIYLKLCQTGMVINHKRVDRFYAEAGLQIRKRKCKKISVANCHPLAANQICFMDFVFDRTADGRVIKSLTVVDDATHEAVPIASDYAMSGMYLTRILLDQLAQTRGLAKAIRTDN